MRDASYLRGVGYTIRPPVSAMNGASEPVAAARTLVSTGASSGAAEISRKLSADTGNRMARYSMVLAPWGAAPPNTIGHRLTITDGIRAAVSRISEPSL